MHNFYGSTAPSGENQVFQAEKALLQARGHEVGEFTRHSDEIRAKGWPGAIQGAATTPYNPWMAHAVQCTVEHSRPHVVHVHNTFPLLSPAIFQAIGHRAARVLTLHNYRLFCPAAIPMRDGKVCTECLDRHSVWPAIKWGCYRGSRAATLPLALSVALHRHLGTWQRQVDAFITLTEFQREVMIQAGLPSQRVHVKPNFYPGKPVSVPWDERDEYVVFAGRLTSEKGVETLVKAWLQWGEGAPELRILGDGPLRKPLENLVASTSSVKVHFFGQVSSSEAQKQIAQAKLLVLPSVSFEGFPMVIREAFAFGTPAAVSAIGPLPSIVHHGKNGVIFAPGDAGSLLQEVRTAWEAPNALAQMAYGAQQAFERNYTEEANYRTLMEIYEKAMAINREGNRG